MQEAMELKNDDGEMKRFLKLQFGECNPLVKLIQATPPHQIHRRRIEVTGAAAGTVAWYRRI